MEAFAPIQDLKGRPSGVYKAHFQIRDVTVGHIEPLAKMLSMLEKSFYAIDYKTELVADSYGSITFDLYTDEAEIAEYVNRLFVAAQ